MIGDHNEFQLDLDQITSILIGLDLGQINNILIGLESLDLDK